MLVLNLVNKKPVSVKRISSGIIPFDVDGKPDATELNRELQLVSELLTICSDKTINRENNRVVIESHGQFAEKRLKHEFSWQPDEGLIQVILDKIFKEKKARRKRKHLSLTSYNPDMSSGPTIKRRGLGRRRSEISGGNIQMLQMEAKCQNCKFFTETNSENADGECRITAPTVIQVICLPEASYDEDKLSCYFTCVFPEVLNNNYCGEYVAQDNLHLRRACKDCKFFQILDFKDDSEDKYGQCIKKAPKVLPGYAEDEEFVTTWPQIESKKWCGQWQAKCNT